MLLNGSIENDYRVIKIIKSISQSCKVDLFYVGGTKKDTLIFGDNVRLFSQNKGDSFYDKLIRNTLFFYEYNFFIDMVLKKKIIYDLVYANDLPMLYPSSKLASKFGAKLIYDSHEIYIETINQFFPKRTIAFKKIAYFICKFIMKFFGEIVEGKLVRKTYCMITVNNSLKEYFIRKYNPNRIEVIMNYPYLNLKKQKPIDYRRLYGWDKEDVIFIYQGALTYGRGLHLILKAMKVASEKCKLIILGDGFIKTDLKSIVDSANITCKVKFIDKVSLEELTSYTLGADVGVNLLESINLSKKLASPNKLFEYIHAGIPIFCTKTKENVKVLNKYDLGLLTENTVDSIVSNMHLFLEIDKNKYKENCRRAANEYSWENQDNTIQNIINKRN